MINSNYRVSIIIPTYKRDIKLLSRAIDSVINQTYENIEIIIIDDNPPDSKFRKDVINFMQQYKDNDKIVYILNAQNVGGSIARNNGIKEATGQYITFLDDDDEYLSGKVEKQLQFMIENDCDMSFANLKLVNENKVVIDYRDYEKLEYFDNLSLLKYHLTRQIVGTPTFMYKTDKLREIGGFVDAKMGQEFYLMHNTIKNGLKICYFNDCDVIAYRHNYGGISHGPNKIEGEKTLYGFKKQYFAILSKSEKNFINFRHYAVMAVAYKRNKNYLKAIKNIFLMFGTSPKNSLKETNKFVKNIIKHRKIINQE